MFKDKKDFTRQIEATAIANFGKPFGRLEPKFKYYTLAKTIATNARNVRVLADDTRQEEKKRVYYFSMEFLVGRLLENYIMNFGIKDVVEEGLADYGVTIADLAAQEVDAGLGNGGLGRLAACFIDSLASLGYIGQGNGIRYRYGLFSQRIVNGCQVEDPDNWLEDGYPWEIERPEEAVRVRFGGTVVHKYSGNSMSYEWTGGEEILAVPYDVPIVGYGGQTVNNLRLWSAEPAKQNFDMDAFNRGDYAGAMKFRSDVEAITSVLYPNDNADPGKVLRLKQEYMFVAAGLKSILRYYKREYGKHAWKRFPELIAIHTNDTHPALCAPELLRLLIDEEGLDWDTAWEIVTKSISYTNHTILPEALEKWPIDMFQRLLPRVYDFVEEIDRRYRESFARNRVNNQELLMNTAILWGGQVRMANLSVIAGHAVNGVAALHTEILKADVLKDFYALTPEKFNNKTNGVTHRRFLAQANPTYAALITEAIGDRWYTDAMELARLKDFENDPVFLEKAARSKAKNKQALARYIKDTTGIIVDTDSIFDIQVKRFHAYKRQLLNLFKIMDLYNHILEDPNFDVKPTTFIFAGKAAQGYEFAKNTIRLVCSVADVINSDPRVRGRIRVVFVPNFSVSNGQLIYPAADISEQISTAGMEASGTGCMKFMMNGALTLGTLDGANVEIVEQVGMENAEIFGLKTEEIAELKRSWSYFARGEVDANPRLRRVMDQLTDGTYAKLSGGFDSVYSNLMNSNDEFYVLKDFQPYVDAWHRLENLHADKNAWYKKSVHNTACSGIFSSDRTIREYAQEVWNLN